MKQKYMKPYSRTSWPIFKPKIHQNSLLIPKNAYNRYNQTKTCKKQVKKIKPNTIQKKTNNYTNPLKKKKKKKKKTSLSPKDIALPACSRDLNLQLRRRFLEIFQELREPLPSHRRKSDGGCSAQTSGGLLFTKREALCLLKRKCWLDFGDLVF